MDHGQAVRSPLDQLEAQVNLVVRSIAYHLLLHVFLPFTRANQSYRIVGTHRTFVCE